MKRFMIVSVALVLCLLGLYFAVYYGGLYVDFRPDLPVEATVKTDGKTILVQTESGIAFEPFTVRGVNLPSSLPGHTSSDFAVEEETWLRWFRWIQEMGANTIRIYTIYDDTFYNAFYRFNTEAESPLYLLQGLQVSDYANNAGGDAYAPSFYAALRQDALDAVDVVHGRKNILLNRMKGSGSYRRDVSPWVLGYVVGNEWNAGTIAYTNHNRENDAAFVGDYFYTTEDATAFEVLLAKVLDGMVGYESAKYKTQKLVSFQNDPENDPFVYEETYARQLGKFNQLDAAHLKTTEKLRSGFFAAYRLYEYCPDFAQYLAEPQKAALGGALDRLDASLYNQGYTQLLSEYHTVPVVITGYGFSSSRGTDTADGPLTERQQGERLMRTYEDIVRSGCGGACIDTWQDVWERRTWNTSYAVDVTNASYWHDVQTDGQGYGLLAFDPGKETSVCYVDGDRTEWSRDDQILSRDGLTLSARYDERSLYLLVEQEGLTERTALILPMDVTPRSGSKRSAAPAASFEREADFLLCLNGRTDSRLLVQARYEALRENYLMQTAGEDPFVEYPAKDAPEFVPIRMILQKHKLVPPEASEQALLEAKLSDTFETGRLRYGNGNPASGAYHSLADFCYGDGFVEVRIPWQLLNFRNPAKMEVHDDYYAHYGVEGLPIRALYVGVGAAGGREPIAMSPLALQGWRESVTVHERLKQSYEVVRESWGRQNAAVD